MAGVALASVGPPERQTMASISTLGDFVSAREFAVEGFGRTAAAAFKFRVAVDDLAQRFVVGRYRREGAADFLVTLLASRPVR